MSVRVRQARHDDAADVAAFTADVWPDREMVDYIPDVFDRWVDSDGPAQRTVVAEAADGSVVGLCQGILLSDHEAWLQGMRMDPDHRGGGHGLAMVEDLFDWARDNGATVARNMVFSWNDAGLGQSVAAGFEPTCEFRWAHPEPRDADPSMTVESDPAAAWSYWTRSDARTALSGLALDAERSWALSELTPASLDRLADERAVFAVKGNGTRGMACRVRTTQDSTSDEPLAEYAVGAWADADAAAALFDAIRTDAAAIGVGATRVLIPETPRHVAEAAFVRAGISEWPDFVLTADLTGVE
ncbi:GNAT family N-acetyltransferase [Halomicroarcula sp. GCM10025324]|uniref:GNAT family N-acetyltransferase n=1 Tax=Haloarcula TaxID=2237 RepID=UPI0023E87DB9|nr:GNAT family N-acetyltransferase [Halomicroarcula sp. ZS-22-S1]